MTASPSIKRPIYDETNAELRQYLERERRERAHREAVETMKRWSEFVKSIACIEP